MGERGVGHRLGIVVDAALLIASGNLLHGPAIAVRIAEEDERAPVELLHLADIRPSLGELRTRCVYVRDDQLHTLDRARLRLRVPDPIAIEQADPGGVS